MNRNNKMIFSYLAGGILVLGLVPSVIYLLTLLTEKLVPLPLFHSALTRWLIAGVLAVPGWGFALWSLIIQNTKGEGGPLEIGELEISPKTRKLVTSGPYRYTRNPMLFGAFLLYLAYALTLNSLSSLFLVLLLFFLMLRLVVPIEERRLEKDFGEAYREYRKSVAVFFPRFSKR